MAIFRLTESNIQYVKRELRCALPDVKSSHLTEAIAAGFGYRTNAALIAYLGASTFGAEPLVRVDEHSWLSRLSDFGYPETSNGLLLAVARSERLPDPCWRELRQGQLYENNHWYRRCQAQNIPNIWFEVARKYAKLRWDCISLDPHYEHVIRNNEGRPFGKLLFEKFRSCVEQESGNPKYLGSAFTGDIEGLLPEAARIIADEFFFLLYNASREWRPRNPEDKAPHAMPALRDIKVRTKAA